MCPREAEEGDVTLLLEDKNKDKISSEKSSGGGGGGGVFFLRLFQINNFHLQKWSCRDPLKLQGAIRPPHLELDLRR